MNFFNFYPGDYLRDTADLSLLEHGAFVTLLATYYATERPLPTELDKLWRICRAVTEEERAAVVAVVERFFPRRGGVLRNARADREIAKAQPRIAAARANGRAGGRPKRKPDGCPDG